jgi:hypothetical protein
MVEGHRRDQQYGMEPGDVATFDSGRCWICRQPERVAGRSLAVDHAHKTGAVRGFLCTRCNNVVGRMEDDPDLLRRAAAYLERAHADHSDMCVDCVVLVVPARILSHEDGRTRFGYECPAGHRWVSERLTRGTPVAWQL